MLAPDRLSWWGVGVKYTTGAGGRRARGHLISRKLGRPAVNMPYAEALLPGFPSPIGSGRSIGYAIREEMARTLMMSWYEELGLGCRISGDAIASDAAHRMEMELGWTRSAPRVERELLKRFYEIK